MEELDGIFKGDDVFLVFLVDVLDHGGLRGAFPRPGDPRHQNQASLHLRNRAQNLRESEVLEGGHIDGDGTHHDHEASALPQNVHPETTEAGKTP